jgi:rhamnogalacturonan acetylesterase
MHRFKHDFLLPALLLFTTAAIPQTPAAASQAAATNAPLNRALPTLFIVGDSTARNQADLGWGDHLARYFDTTRINIANRARPGRSSRTFINEGSWDNMLGEMKPGDFVLIQMSHNEDTDPSGIAPRGSLKGIGNEEQQITLPNGGEQILHTYGWYIRHYIDDTRGEQSTPILLSLTLRNLWATGRNGRPRIERDDVNDTELATIAKEQNIAYVDMASDEAHLLEAIGPEKAASFFSADNTDTSAQGAEHNAASVVVALRMAKSPLTTYLKPDHNMVIKVPPPGTLRPHSSQQTKD